MLMMVKKRVRGGIWHAIHWYAEVNNKYMKNYNKSIESIHLMYWDGNNLYVWTILQKLPANGFKRKKNVSKSNEEFIKNYDEDSNKKYILKVDLEYSLRNSTICIAIYYSYQKEWKLKNTLSKYTICMIRKKMLLI